MNHEMNKASFIRSALALSALLIAGGTLAACSRHSTLNTGSADTAATEADAPDPADAAAAAAVTAGEAPAPPAVAAVPANPNAKPVAVQESAGSAEDDEGAAPSKSDATLERLTALPEQDQLPGGKWAVGKNYKPIVPAQPTNVGPGKVEVVEVFWYGCGHCYALDPFLESWKKNKPAYVEFVRVPVMWGPVHKIHAHLFYTLQALDRTDLHTKVFDTIHRGGNMLAGNDAESSYKMQVAWAEQNGIKADDFKKAWDSFGVNSALQRAEQLTKRYLVEGVPMVVVDGKYSTDVGMAGGQSQLITLINDLAASEKRR
jgi:thiol:disulfide interchange protein DsbA